MGVSNSECWYNTAHAFKKQPTVLRIEITKSLALLGFCSVSFSLVFPLKTEEWCPRARLFACSVSTVYWQPVKGTSVGTSCSLLYYVRFTSQSTALNRSIFYLKRTFSRNKTHWFVEKKISRDSCISN